MPRPAPGGQVKLVTVADSFAAVDRIAYSVVERVVSGAAVADFAARFTGKCLIARVALKRIVAQTARQAVIASAAINIVISRILG